MQPSFLAASAVFERVADAMVSGAVEGDIVGTEGSEFVAAVALEDDLVRFDEVDGALSFNPVLEE